MVPARPHCDHVGNRSRARTLVVAVCVLALLAGCAPPTPEAATPAGQEDEPTTETRRTVPGPVEGAVRASVPAVEPDSPDPTVVVVGDSVAVLVADALARELDGPIVIDAVDCRRLDRGFRGPCGGVPDGATVGPTLDRLASIAASVTDPGAVGVIVLANNAALQAEDLEEAMATLAGFPRVWWVAARVAGPPWQGPNNALLAELAARDPRAGVVDWFAASEGQPWLADAVHPNSEGQVALAALIAEHVRCDCTP